MPVKVFTRGPYAVMRIADRKPGDGPVKAIQARFDELLGLRKKDCVLDLSELTQLYSHLLGLISDAYRRINARNGTLTVVITDPEVEETYNLSGLNLLARTVRSFDDIRVDTTGGPPAAPSLQANIQAQIKTQREGDFIVVEVPETATTLQGARAVNELVEDLVSQGYTRFLFDLSKLETVSSDVLTHVGLCYNKVKLRNGEVAVISSKSELCDLLDLSGLNGIVACYDTREDFSAHLTERSYRPASEHTILIVDDSRVMREMLLRLVTEIGHRAITATNGKEAIEKTLSEQPDVVLMDVHMPEMDGYQACREIKNRLSGRYIPIVFVTTLQEPRERLNALRAGGDDFVNKPVQREDLLFRIGTQLRVKELTEDLQSVNENLEQTVVEKSAALVETERQLYQAEKMSAIGTMLSGIAHELKNPIFIIGSWAQMLKQTGGLTEEQTKAVDFIQDQATRSSTIVENLLKLVRKKVEHVKRLDINEIIDGIRQNLSYLVVNKEVQIETELEARARIEGNAAEIEQVVVNLVSNAVDAISDKGTVTVRSRENDKWSIIEVADDGKGMSEDVKRKVFDPFFTTKDPGKGTGLGMSIIYKIVENHRGKVSVDSQEGRGTTISVCFPRHG